MKQNWIGLHANAIMISFFLFFSGCESRQDQRVTLDVNAIANKSPHEVKQILGTPDSTYRISIMGKKIFCERYKQYNLEIQYPAMRATEMTVYETRGLPFNQTALKAFRIDYREQHPSDYMKNNFIRWSNIDEFSAITFYNPRKDSLNNITAFNVFFKVRERQSDTER